MHKQWCLNIAQHNRFSGCIWWFTVIVRDCRWEFSSVTATDWYGYYLSVWHIIIVSCLDSLVPLTCFHCYRPRICCLTMTWTSRLQTLASATSLWWAQSWTRSVAVRPMPHPSSFKVRLYTLHRQCCTSYDKWRCYCQYFLFSFNWPFFRSLSIFAGSQDNLSRFLKVRCPSWDFTSSFKALKGAEDHWIQLGKVAHWT